MATDIQETVFNLARLMASEVSPQFHKEMKRKDILPSYKIR